MANDSMARQGTEPIMSDLPVSARSRPASDHSASAHAGAASDAAARAAAGVFPGESVMARLCRAHDWAATPLGPVHGWPRNLRVAVDLVLASAFPTLVCWGPDLVQLYNDAYVAIIGAKHPWALGRPTAEVWPEVWHLNAPLFRRAQAGETVHLVEAPYRLERRGPDQPADDTCFTLSFSPVRDELGDVGGVVVTAVEVTAQVAGRAAQVELALANQELRERAAEQAVQAEALRATAARLAAQVEATERARAAAAESERQLRTLADAIPTLAWTARADGFIDWYNAGWYAYTGTTPEDMVGWGWQRVHDPAVLPTVLERWRASIASGEPFEMTFPLRGADGTFRPFLTRVAPARDAGADGARGRVVRWFGTNTDLSTERAAAAERERLLAETERARGVADAERARLAGVLAAMGDAHIAMDRDWRVVAMNPAAERVNGRPAAHFLGRTHWEAWPASLGTEIERHYREAMATRTAAHFETHYVEPGVLETWVSVDVVPTPDGGLGLFFRDVSARKQAEAEREQLLADVRAANAELRRLAAEAQAAERRARFLAELGQALQPVAEPDAVMRTTARLLGEHLGADRCAYAEVESDEDTFTITGNYTRGDTASIVGRFTFRAFGAEVLRLMRANAPYVVDDADADPRVTPPDRAAYAATQIQAVVCVPLHKAGRFVAAMAVHQRAPRRWTPDEVALVVTVVQRCWEALERARALRRLQESEAALQAASLQLAERTAAAEAAQRAAEAANLTKTQFLSAMSHELRTPLNAIGGYAELLAMGVRGPVTDAQRADLERLLRANQHMGGLVTTVLDFARTEAGQIEYHLEAVPLGPLVHDLEVLLGPQFAVKGLTYTHDGGVPRGGPAETPDGPHAVWADPDKVRQILLNLLTNAAKFTAAGGRVALACAADRSARVIRLRVTDTGRGIAPDQLERVFEPFVQLDRHRTEASQQGVGLGLAISRDLARGMGGDLTAESAVGVGSTFTLTLPAAT